MARDLANRVHNGADVVDSRDILERIAELESERDAMTLEIFMPGGTIEHEGQEWMLVATSGADDTATFENEDERTITFSQDEALKKLVAWRYDAESEIDDAVELRTLTALVDDINANAGDSAKDGVGLIRDDYFVTYAEELADDIGAINKKAEWPNNFIDWDAAAEALQQDYSAIEWDGVTYWVRS